MTEEKKRFVAACDGCGLVTIVTWDGERGFCDDCKLDDKYGDLDP